MYLSKRLEKNKIKKSKLLLDKIICGKNKIIRLIYSFDNKIYDNKNDDRSSAASYVIIIKKYKKILYFNILIFKQYRLYLDKSLLNFIFILLSERRFFRVDVNLLLKKYNLLLKIKSIIISEPLLL